MSEGQNKVNEMNQPLLEDHGNFRFNYKELMDLFDLDDMKNFISDD
jgi:hypothetical protein